LVLAVIGLPGSNFPGHNKKAGCAVPFIFVANSLRATTMDAPTAPYEPADHPGKGPAMNFLACDPSPCLIANELQSRFAFF
jgi:hypothetical protein